MKVRRTTTKKEVPCPARWVSHHALRIAGGWVSDTGRNAVCASQPSPSADLHCLLAKLAHGAHDELLAQARVDRRKCGTKTCICCRRHTHRPRARKQLGQRSVCRDESTEQEGGDHETWHERSNRLTTTIKR